MKIMGTDKGAEAITRLLPQKDIDVKFNKIL